MKKIIKFIFAFVLISFAVIYFGVSNVRADQDLRIWVLPFENIKKEPSADHLKEIMPELLTVFFSQSSRSIVLDRADLNRVIQEQKLPLYWDVSKEERIRIGKLLSATVMISGNFRRDDTDLIVNAHAFDVGSGRLIVSDEVKGQESDLAGLADKLFKRLAKGLGDALPDFEEGQIDESPAANLHFMQGLSYFYSAHYNQALVEFIAAAREEKIEPLARFWLANCYMEKEEYGHAYIELKQLSLMDLDILDKNKIGYKLKVCLENFADSEEQIYSQIIK